MKSSEVSRNISLLPLPVESQDVKVDPNLKPTDQKVNEVIREKIVLTEEEKAEAMVVGADVVALSSTTALLLVNLIIGIAALYLYNAFRDK